MDLRLLLNSPTSSDQRQEEMPHSNSSSEPIDAVPANSNDILIIEKSSQHGAKHINKSVPVKSREHEADDKAKNKSESASKEDSTSRTSRRRSSNAYPFSDQHLARHQSNEDTGFYEVKNFEEHLIHNLAPSADRLRRHSISHQHINDHPSTPDAHPEILENREKKFRGRSMSQPHLDHLTALDIPQKKASVYSEEEEAIKTEKVPSSTFKSSSRRMSFLQRLVCRKDDYDSRKK